MDGTDEFQNLNIKGPMSIAVVERTGLLTKTARAREKRSTKILLVVAQGACRNTNRARSCTVITLENYNIVQSKWRLCIGTYLLVAHLRRCAFHAY